MKKPALRLLIGFGSGILFGTLLEPNPPFGWQCVFGGILLTFLLAILIRPSIAAWLGWPVSLCLGFLWFAHAQQAFQNQTISRHCSSQLVGLSGTIVTAPEIQKDRLKWVLRASRLVQSDSAFSVSGRVLVSSRILNLPLRAGEWVGLMGHLRLPSGKRNPGGFDYRAYLKRKKISALFYVSEHNPLQFRQNVSPFNPAYRVIAPLRKHFLLIIQNYFGYGPEAHLLQGLLLGQRGEIEPSVRTAFARTGVIHVLAVSGLHVGFILGILLFLLKFFRPPDWLRLFIILIALVFYANLTGNKPPVIRASLMAFLILLGYQLQRPLDIVNILAFAALLLLLVNPFYLLDLSFQLSFVAVLGILLFYTRILKWMTFSPHNSMQRSIAKYILPLLAVSLAAQLGTLPLILVYYHRVATYALLANLVVIPLVFLIVGGGFFLFILSVISPTLAHGLAILLKFFLKFLIQFVTFFSRLPGGNLEISGHISIWHIFLIMLVFGFIWFATCPRRLRQLVLISLGLGTIWFSWNTLRISRFSLTIDFLDAGKASATVVHLPDGKCLVVNAGTSSPSANETARVLAPFLKYSAFRRVEALFISSFTPAFAGGFPTLRKTFSPGAILYPCTEMPPTFYRRFDAHQEPDTRWTPLALGDHFLSWHGTNLWVFAPDSSQSPELDGALVAKLNFGKRSFLFAEGASVSQQNALRRFGVLLKSDVLILTKQAVPEFLQTISPQFVVLRHQQLSPNFSPSPIRFLSIPQRGCIEFRTNGQKIWVRTMFEGKTDGPTP